MGIPKLRETKNSYRRSKYDKGKSHSLGDFKGNFSEPFTLIAQVRYLAKVMRCFFE